MTNPHDIKMEEISNVSFDTIKGVADIRYFDAQQNTLNHRVEQEINHSFRDDNDVHMEGGRRDPALRDLQCMWLEEESRAGIVDGGSDYYAPQTIGEPTGWDNLRTSSGQAGCSTAAATTVYI